ncbi:MAG TPA: CPBP family intramembrane glutamic endopeptidase [Chitinophagaceae bacterium]
MENFPAWADHILAFLVGIVIPLQTSYRNAKNPLPDQFDSRQKKSFYLSGSFSLFLIAFIIMLVWLLFKRPLEEIGFRKPGDNKSYWWLVLIFIALYIIDTALSVGGQSNREKTIQRWKTRTAFMPTLPGEFPLYLLLCFSAGVFEEIIFRGFLVTYCYYLFSGADQQEFWAVILPALIFSIAHYYQGSKAVLKILVFSCLFGFIFTRSGSLLIVMLLHFLVDAAGGLLTLRLMNKETK